METIKINRLEIENVKRIKAVKIEPAQNGLTVIGGKNGQGKTSVLDSIAWALGGEKYRPSEAQRRESVVPPNLQVLLSNGLIVERKGKNSELKVTDPRGGKGGQQLLNEFIEQLALDLPRFMEASAKEKVDTLLKIIGVGETLAKLDQQENELYNRRRTIGQIADQKGKFAKEQPYYPEVPKDLISVSELIKSQQSILAKNGENQRKRNNLTALENKAADIQRQLDELQKNQSAVLVELEIARKSVEELQDESTAELERNISEIETINRKIRANLDREKAEDDAKQYSDQYARLDGELDIIRKSKTDLLTNADMPLPNLNVENGELTYNGNKWDNISGSEQLMIATAIVRRLNPKCGFVLLDKLEQMDIDTLREFGEWLESEELQVIATRVSTGDECSVIISDGYIDEETPKKNISPKWIEGEF